MKRLSKILIMINDCTYYYYYYVLLLLTNKCDIVDHLARNEYDLEMTDNDTEDHLKLWHA